MNATPEQLKDPATWTPHVAAHCAGYPPMPADRPHPCCERNKFDIPVAWVEYAPKYGFSLAVVSCMGDELAADIAYCPLCGEKLTPPGDP